MTANASHQEHHEIRETGPGHGDVHARADGLLRLHRGPGPLVLPSAWDAGTARLLERAGAAAVAVSAAGVVWSLGDAGPQPHGDEELVAACAHVCRSVAVPVAVDLRGAPYGGHDLPALVEALVAPGVAGVTLPDPGREEDAVRLHDAVRAAARRSGVRPLVTARTGRGAVTRRGPARGRAPRSCRRPGRRTRCAARRS